MPFTHFQANKILAKLFGKTAFGDVDPYYLGLFTVLPTLTGGGTEVVGGSYARVSVANNTTNFPASTVSSEANTVSAAFPTPSAGWGSVVAVGLFDAATAGNLVAWYQLPTPRTIASGDNYAFPVGNIIARNV